MHQRLRLEAREKELFKKELLERLEALFGSAENINKPEDRLSDCSSAPNTETSEQRDLSMNQLLSGGGYGL